MIPYFQIPSLSLPGYDSIAIHPFGVLVATGILVGATLTRRRGRKLGLDDENVKSMIFWAVFTGFIVSHICDVLFYQDHPTTKSLILALADPRSGLSSMFGFAGAVLGLVLWCRNSKEPIMPYADSLAYGLAIGWMFGRMGCYVAHDHPGNLVNHEWYSFLGVDYPCGEPHCLLDRSKGWIVTAANSDPNFRRYDMGFFEVLVAGALATFYFMAERFKPRCGFFVAAIALYYGPVRFILDYLRVKGVAGADPRWPANASWGLTPAQYAAVLVSLAGIILIVRVRQKPPLYPSD